MSAFFVLRPLRITGNCAGGGAEGFRGGCRDRGQVFPENGGAPLNFSAHCWGRMWWVKGGGGASATAERG
jgi:hypothetical protein